MGSRVQVLANATRSRGLDADTCERVMCQEAAAVSYREEPPGRLNLSDEYTEEMKTPLNWAC